MNPFRYEEMVSPVLLRFLAFVLKSLSLVSVFIVTFLLCLARIFGYGEQCWEGINGVGSGQTGPWEWGGVYGGSQSLPLCISLKRLKTTALRKSDGSSKKA